jgi:hypothetical protein
MKTDISRMCLIVLCILAGEAALAEEKCSPVREDVQIVSEELEDRLVEKGSEFANTRWPANLAATRVKRDDIPEGVFSKTTKWLRTMIKPEWLPDDPAAWMTGVRKEKPHKGDYLVLRYKVATQTIQIQEDGAALCILIDTGSFADMQPQAFLTSIVRKFLRYPDDKLASLQFYLDSFKYERRKICCGTMDCDFDRYDTEAYLRRTWYNHTYVWTDGRRAYFGLVEMDGEPSKRKRARPGLPKRFKTSK